MPSTAAAHLSPDTLPYPPPAAAVAASATSRWALFAAGKGAVSALESADGSADLFPFAPAVAELTGGLDPGEIVETLADGEGRYSSGALDEEDGENDAGPAGGGAAGGGGGASGAAGRAVAMAEAPLLGGGHGGSTVRCLVALLPPPMGLDVGGVRGLCCPPNTAAVGLATGVGVQVPEAQAGAMC